MDENLSPYVTQALRLVNYNTKHGTELFPQGTIDPQVLQWLGLQQAVWVTADEKARRKHIREIQDAGIHIIWVRRPKEGMSAKAQLLLILWVLDPILGEINEARQPSQFRALYSGQRPKWERL